MIIFDVLVKRKTSLDQLKQGLSTLNVLGMIQQHPEDMKKYFVSSGDICPDHVLKRIEFVNGTPSEKHAFNEVVKQMNQNNIKRFLMYATGAPSLWPLRSRILKIEFIDSDTFGNSTCFFSIESS